MHKIFVSEMRDSLNLWIVSCTSHLILHSLMTSSFLPCIWKFPCAFSLQLTCYVCWPNQFKLRLKGIILNAGNQLENIKCVCCLSVCCCPSLNEIRLYIWNNSRINPVIFRKLHIVLGFNYTDFLIIGLFGNWGVKLVQWHAGIIELEGKQSFLLLLFRFLVSLKVKNRKQIVF